MNFALSKKYSEIDLAEVSPSDLVLIGGGCGESGGGSVTVYTIQAAGQAAEQVWVAGVPGREMTVYYTVNGGYGFGDPPGLTYGYATRNGNVNGTATVNQSSGVTTSSSGGFWGSVGSFFSWLFGSH